jgi:hypothetical protein
VQVTRRRCCRCCWAVLRGQGRKVVLPVAHTHKHTRDCKSAGDQAQVLSLLLGSAEGEEECRTVVAECLGGMALLSPDKVRCTLYYIWVALRLCLPCSTVGMRFQVVMH